MSFVVGEIESEIESVPLWAFKKFLHDTKDEHVKSSHYLHELEYMTRNKKLYPWMRRVLEKNGEKFHNYSEYRCFKQLKKIVDSLPIIPETRSMTFICQLTQSDYDFDYHFDNENLYGFRVCYGLSTTDPFLEFKQVRSDFENDAKVVKKISEDMTEGATYKFTPKKVNTLLCVDASKFLHRVPIIKNGPRAVVVIKGDLAQDFSLDFNFIQKIESE